LVDDERWRRFETRRDSIAELSKRLSTSKVNGDSLLQILRRPETTWDDVCQLDPSIPQGGFSPDVIAQVLIETKYNGYIGRQIEQIERFRRLEDKAIPADLDYRAIPQLRVEAREKFARIRPLSLGQAGRISGISPSDIATLLIHLKRRNPPVPIQGSAD
jgi:tRNA uridine 5-carboxymethylaminomethyl modification enzyme